MSLQLKLYVVDRTPRTRRAIAQVRRVFNKIGLLNYDIEVIDVLDQPERARQDQIIATPTLIRTAPLPQRRVLGDFSNHEQVLASLDLLCEQPESHPNLQK